MQLDGFEEVVLPGPQAAARALGEGSELAAFGLDRVFGVVGVLDEFITLLRQGRGSVQNLLRSRRSDRSIIMRVNLKSTRF